MNQMIIDALKTADAIGFEKAAPLARDALIFREEVRATCRPLPQLRQNMVVPTRLRHA